MSPSPPARRSDPALKTGTPTWIRLPTCAPGGVDADDDGAALVAGGGDTMTSVALVSDTLAEAAGAISRNDGLDGVAAQAATEIATTPATLALTTTDEYRIEPLLRLRCHGERPKVAGKGSIFATWTSSVRRHMHVPGPRSATPQRRRENRHLLA